VGQVAVEHVLVCFRGRNLYIQVDLGGRGRQSGEIERDTTPVSPAAGAVVELLKVLLKARAEDAGVASKLIATVADLEKIANDDHADTQDGEPPKLAQIVLSAEKHVDDKKAFWRLPTLYKTLQNKNVADKLSETFPLIMTSGRLVEYEGGGEETRSNPWLAELQQDMFIEINPKTAADRGIRNGEQVWVSTPTGARLKVMAQVTPRVGPDTVFASSV